VFKKKRGLRSGDNFRKKRGGPRKKTGHFRRKSNKKGDRLKSIEGNRGRSLKHLKWLNMEGKPVLRTSHGPGRGEVCLCMKEREAGERNGNGKSRQRPLKEGLGDRVPLEQGWRQNLLAAEV